MLDNEKLLFDDLYEKTKDCGRVQFVELLMAKERENKQLKDNWNDLKKYAKEIISTDNELYGTDLLDKMLELEKAKVDD